MYVFVFLIVCVLVIVCVFVIVCVVCVYVWEEECCVCRSLDSVKGAKADSHRSDVRWSE